MRVFYIILIFLMDYCLSVIVLMSILFMIMLTHQFAGSACCWDCCE
jgi:hypothetical protein